ncbi:MAG TPA: hypothetical protein PKI88_06965, partial [Agitococcus sp.]|nr:hypothetical protein [Agitococcus sp.]
MFRPLLTALTVAIFASHSYAESLDDLRAELAKQKAQIAAQQSQLEALATAVENQKATASNSATTVGFYGEVHYNSFKEPDPAIGKNNVHAHRA